MLVVRNSELSSGVAARAVWHFCGLGAGTSRERSLPLKNASNQHAVKSALARAVLNSSALKHAFQIHEARLCNRYAVLCSGQGGVLTKAHTTSQPSAK